MVYFQPSKCISYELRMALQLWMPGFISLSKDSLFLCYFLLPPPIMFVTFENRFRPLAKSGTRVERNSVDQYSELDAYFFLPFFLSFVNGTKHPSVYPHCKMNNNLFFSQLQSIFLSRFLFAIIKLYYKIMKSMHAIGQRLLKLLALNFITYTWSTLCNITGLRRCFYFLLLFIFFIFVLIYYLFLTLFLFFSQKQKCNINNILYNKYTNVFIF